MSQTRSAIVASLPATNAFSENGKITNFSCDCLFLTLSGAAAVAAADLGRIVVRVQFKNSKGNNAIVVNSVPLIILAKYSDYIGGWGENSSDKYGSVMIPVGNICLEGDDELDITISGTGLSQAYSLAVFGWDTYIGAEKVLMYDYVAASASQTYQQVDALAVYMALGDLSIPSDSVTIAVSDYFGRNIITENEAIGIGAALARSGDWDDFGCVWSDDTGLSQDMSFKAGSSSELFLIIRRFFDSSRLGVGQKSVIDYADYLKYIKQHNPVKYQCLQYAAKLDMAGSK